MTLVSRRADRRSGPRALLQPFGKAFPPVVTGRGVDDDAHHRRLVERAIVDALREFDAIVAAAVYGSWAKRETHADSDIDLLLLASTTIRWAHVRDAVDEVEAVAGRDIHFAGYETRDFLGRGISPYGFLARILGGQLVPLIGDVRAWHPPFRSKDHVPRVARDRGVKYGGRHRGITYPK